MRLRLQRTSRRPSDFGLPAWAGLAWLALVGVFEIVKRVAGQPTATVCIIRNLTGVPCPTCGSTRSVLAGLRGDFVGAFLENPFVFVALFVLAAWLTLVFVFARRPVLELSPGGRRMAWIAVAALFLLNWGWVVLRDRG